MAWHGTAPNMELIMYIYTSSFQGGVSRSINISYLRAVPLSKSPDLFSFHCSLFTKAFHRARLSSKNSHPQNASFANQLPTLPIFHLPSSISTALNWPKQNSPTDKKVHITGRVAQHGRTMALIRGEMTSPDGSTVYATCEHHKVNVPPGKSIDELKQAMQDETKRRGGDRSWLDNATAVRKIGPNL